MKFRNPLPAFALSMVMLLGVFTASVPLTGCTYSTAAIQADANAVATACHQIANVLAATDAVLADRLNMAATALMNAVANFQTGSVATDINTAANIIEVVLASIPLTAPYSALIAIAVTALDVLLANIPGNATAALALPRTPNPYRGAATISHHFMYSPSADFKTAWNAKAATTPGFYPIR